MYVKPNYVRHEKGNRNSRCTEGGGPIFTGYRSEWNSLYFGQIPVNPADGKVQEDIVAAAHQSLKNIGAILKEAGMTYDNVVKTTVLLADIADFKAVNEVYAEYFTGDKPARACYQAAALPLGVKVEIEAIAVK